MSQPDSRSTRPTGILVHKPQTTIYSALLGVALAAIVIGCLLLLLELYRYGFDVSPSAEGPRTAATEMV